MQRPTKPRCYLVHALAPPGLSAAEANRHFNAFVADEQLPLCLFHDHYLGTMGGVAIFYVATPAERDMLYESDHLTQWQVTMHPLIFSHNPAAFDEQIAFTLRTYRHADWEQLQQEKRPAYGNPAHETITGTEA